MGIIDRSALEKVKDVSIVDVIQDIGGIKLTKRGANYSCLCPFHNERTASFSVSPKRNTYICYTCKKHGDGIQFLIDHKGLEFNDAVRKIASLNNIEIKESAHHPTDEEIEKYKKKESLIKSMNLVQEYFVKSLEEDNDKAKKAREYAFGRWGEKYCKESGIGFAPDSWDNIIESLGKMAVSPQMLIDLGIAKKSDKSDRIYSLFRQRITIPIKDRLGNIVAYTARYIGEDPEASKYINCPETDIYKKSNIVFGLNVAARNAAKSDRFIIVEGAPDVLTLQSDDVGLAETVAPLGTALTSDQLGQMSKISKNLCFIPDGDPAKPNEKFGAGIKAVMKNGAVALAMGFNVSVREIPADEEGQKQDPDSFIKNKEIFANLEDVRFSVWYARKVFSACSSESEKAVAMSQIASEVLMHIEDEIFLSIDIDSISKIYGKPKLWKIAIAKAKEKIVQEKKKKRDINLTEEQSSLKEHGIIIKDGAYGEYKDGGFNRWSNFTMTPLFHIIDGDNAIRIFRIVGQYGRNAEIELRQDELVSLQKFQQRVESVGNFIFRAKMDQLIKLKEYLYSITKSAMQISKMGWSQTERLYAFGDGVLIDGEFYQADELGVVHADERSYYLPAFSKMHAEDREAFQFERSFSAKEHGDTDMNTYLSKMIRVFGDNAKVGFAFIVASLFHDVVKQCFKGFPMLNIFGQKGSGKTELGTALMSFFIKNNNPPSLAVTTVASLNEILSSAENNVIHLDEYKNEIDFRKIEMLKGIWGGTGQTKKNMDGDKKVKKTFVRSGVIITGQDMPTRDDALFSRVIHLSFSKNTHTKEEKMYFEDFQKESSKGAVHLTMEILKLRDVFEKDYMDHISICKKQLMAALSSESAIEDRLLNNWLIPLAAFHVLHTLMTFPFSYEDLFKITVDGIKDQQEKLSKNSDIAEFWKILDSAHMQGKIINKAHFAINIQSEFKRSNSETYDFGCNKKILYINYGSICAAIGQRVNGTNMVGKLDQTSLESYLKAHPAFLGPKQYRFRILQPNGQPDFDVIKNAFGGITKRLKEIRPMAFAFDYDLLCQSYQINLEVMERMESEEDYQ